MPGMPPASTSLPTNPPPPGAPSFLDGGTGKVGKGTQSEQAFALGFGAASAAARPAVFERLVEQSHRARRRPAPHHRHLRNQYLLEELSRHGRSDLAFALADRKTFPSWGWMLENDATTLWEHWAGSEPTTTGRSAPPAPAAGCSATAWKPPRPARSPSPRWTRARPRWRAQVGDVILGVAASRFPPTRA
jgi:hypothetical protein